MYETGIKTQTLRPVFNVNGEILRYDKPAIKKPYRNLSSTANTIVKCRVCMGRGQIINDSSRKGWIENVCPHCDGTKEMRLL